MRAEAFPRDARAPLEPCLLLNRMSDVYAYEAAEEAKAEQQRIFRPMKEWYATRADLTAAHGGFPSFWRELGSWGPYREVFREFNRYIEAKASGAPLPVGAAVGVSGTVPGAATAPAGGAAEAAGATDGGARKRHRWADAEAPPEAAMVSAAGEGSGGGGDNGAAARRRSRWAGDAAPTAPPPPPPPTLAPLADIVPRQRRFGQRALPALASLLPPGVPATQEALFCLRVRVEEMQLKLMVVPAEARRVSADPNRPPSPDAEYDSTGKRKNTREQRMTKALVEARDALLERISDLNPSLVTGGVPKFLRKLYIPWRKYPSYNFIGLVIGPRGNTQKKLEKETNCKICVRGRGSAKDGKGPSSAAPAGSKRAEEDEDEMHVQITGERLAEVEAAAALIADLLKPVDDDTNEWKKRQLMELAVINGTMRDLKAPCSRCGEPGHRHYECPYADQSARRTTAIVCAICGDGGHVTSDCKQRADGTGEDTGPTLAALESEISYLSFMAELGDANAKSRLAVLEAQVRERRARDAADGAGAGAGAGAAPSGSAGASGGAVTAAPQALRALPARGPPHVGHPRPPSGPPYNGPPPGFILPQMPGGFAPRPGGPTSYAHSQGPPRGGPWMQPPPGPPPGWLGGPPPGMLLPPGMMPPPGYGGYAPPPRFRRCTPYCDPLGVGAPTPALRWGGARASAAPSGLVARCDGRLLRQSGVQPGAGEGVLFECNG